MHLLAHLDKDTKVVRKGTLDAKTNGHSEAAVKLTMIDGTMRHTQSIPAQMLCVLPVTGASVISN